MGMNNFFKGLKIFEEGMQQMATAGAIKDAQKDLETAQLTFAESEGMTPEQVGVENKYMDEARNRISQGLQSRLAGIGATGTQINAASAFGLTRLQEKTLESNEATQIAKTGRSTAATEMKLKDDIGKQVLQRADKFLTRPTVKTAISSLDATEQSIAILNKFPAKRAVQELVKSGLIKSVEGGRVTDQDIKRMNSDNSFRMQVIRRLGLELGDDDVLQEPAKFYKSLLGAIRDKNIKQLRKEKADAINIVKAAGHLPMDKIKSAIDSTVGTRYTAQENALVDSVIASGKLKPERRNIFLKKLLLQKEAKKK